MPTAKIGVVILKVLLRMISHCRYFICTGLVNVTDRLSALLSQRGIRSLCSEWR